MIVKSLYPGSLITVSWLCFPECTHLSGGQAHDYAGRKHFTECCNRKLFHVSDIEHPTSLSILMTESHAQLCCKFLCYIMLFKLRNKKYFHPPIRFAWYQMLIQVCCTALHDPACVDINIFSAVTRSLQCCRAPRTLLTIIRTLMVRTDNNPAERLLINHSLAQTHKIITGPGEVSILSRAEAFYQGLVTCSSLT